MESLTCLVTALLCLEEIAAIVLLLIYSSCNAGIAKVLPGI